MSEARRPARLWVVDPSVHHAERQGVAEVLHGWTGEHRLFRPGLAPGDGPTPEAGYDLDGVVILGSSASVHDEAPWIAPLARWLGPAVRGELELPVLGVCFGHQLLAHLAGGRVDWMNAKRTKRRAVETTSIGPSRLMDAGPLRVVVSHREEVAEVPPGFQVFAERAGSARDGIEHERLPLWGVQFHPEAREEFAIGSGFDPALVDDRVRADGRRLLAAFQARVRERLPR